MLDEMRDAGIENVIALRGDPPKGETEFKPVPGGLSYGSELAALISESYDFCIGGACYPETHPEAPDAETDLAQPPLQGRRRRELPDHAAVLRQRRLLRVRRARPRERHRPARSSPGIMPINNFEQIKRFTSMCGATIPPAPATSSSRRRAKDGEEAVAELGVAYATLQCADLLARGAPGHPLLHAEQVAGDAGDPVRAQGSTAVGAGERQRSGSCPSGDLTRSTRPVALEVGEEAEHDRQRPAHHPARRPRRTRAAPGRRRSPRRPARRASAIASSRSWISSRFASMCAGTSPNGPAVPR